MIRKQEITTFEFPENAVIWDVRDSSAYAEGHVKGAVSRPINDLNADILNRSLRISRFIFYVVVVAKLLVQLRN